MGRNNTYMFAFLLDNSNKEDFVMKFGKFGIEAINTLIKLESWVIEILVNIASNPKASPQTLRVLANHENSFVRLEVARNPNTSPETLADLAKDKDFFVRLEVARNPNTLPETLAVLANDPACVIRLDVAKNPNTSPETRAALAEDM